MIKDINQGLFSFVVKEKRDRVFECIICLNDFHTIKEPAFDTGNCDHKTCQDCLRRYLTDVLTDITYEDFAIIKCPGANCNKIYLANEVVPVIFSDEEATNWWTSALCSKAYITNKVYCPHDGCGGVFDAEDGHTKECTFAECYQCHKGLCVTCQTKWHPEKIKVFDESEALSKTLDTAKNNKWCKCPYCANLVERSTGCESVLCRCGKYFCYSCGGKMGGYGNCFNKCHGMTSEALADVRRKMYEKDASLKKQ